MANWNNPLITTQYDVFVAETKDRDIDSATMFRTDPSNQPLGSVRFNRVTKVFEEWNGSAWVILVLAITGGGTGANNPGGVVAGLGLGTMSLQNSNAVNISGGTAQLAWVVTALVVPSVDQGGDLGDYRRWKNGRFAGGLEIPVGVDKYIVG